MPRVPLQNIKHISHASQNQNKEGVGWHGSAQCKEHTSWTLSLSLTMEGKLWSYLRIYLYHDILAVELTFILGSGVFFDPGELEM